MHTNAPDAVWDTKPIFDAANNQYWWNSKVNGVDAYVAMITALNGRPILTVWRQADDDAARTEATQAAKDL